MTLPLPSCPKCGQPVPPDAPDELCPGCLLVGGLSQENSPAETKLPDSGGTLHIVIPEDAGFPLGAPKRLGNYDLIERIAQGGMGVVYKARHIGLDRVVALKMIRSGILATPKDVERFQREARAAARLHHPNIVTIHDIGEQDGQHYYTMDYVPGENLADLARAKPFSSRQAAKMTADIAAGIHYAHQQGVLHRDIKPANVILTPEQQPRVLDFGLALVLADNSKLTLSGTPMGSPPYMPPEQSAGQTRRTDARSDVYSLGALLYELLTGHPPFQAASTIEILHLVVGTEPLSPRRLNPALPPDLETICLKALEKAPERRYQSAEELGDELGRFLRDEPIVARPAARTEKLWRWCRRTPLVAGLSVAIVALLLSVAIGSPIALYRIHREEARVLGLSQELKGKSYANDMKEASLAMEEEHQGRAQALMERQLAENRDLRGLEWRYLWTLLRSDDLAVLQGHEGGVMSVAFSPDGQLLASASLDQTVRIWDVPSLREILQLPGGLAPCHQAVAFTPDGKSLAVARDGSLFFHRVSDGRVCREPIVGAKSPIAFSPDGQILVAGSGNDFKVWNTTTWQTSTLNHGSSLVKCLAISSANTLIAVASWGDAPFQVWDLTTGHKVRECDLGVLSLAFTARGDQLAIGEGDGGTRLLSIGSGESVTTETNAVAGIFGVAPYRDGTLLATAAGQSIHIWEQPGLKKRTTLKGHEAAIHSLTYSPATDLLASGSLDSTVRLWRANPDAHTNRVERPSNINFAHLDSTQPRLHSLETNGWVRFWDVVDGRLAPLFALPGDPVDPARFADHVRCSPDDSHAAYGTTDGQVHIYDCAAGTLIDRFTAGVGNVRVGAFSPDNRLLLTLDDTGSLEEKSNGSLWNWQTKQKEASLPDLGTCSHVGAGTFSPDGRLLAYAAGYSVHLWDTVSRQVRLKLERHGWLINVINFSPDGRWLVTSSFDGTTRIWDVSTGRLAVPKLQGESRSAWFTRDGRTLVTCSDKSVRFWSVATGQEFLTIRDATAALLSTDERTLLLWRADGVSQMRIPTLAEIDALRAERPGITTNRRVGRR